jgi:anti-anti-sigma factor
VSTTLQVSDQCCVVLLEGDIDISSSEELKSVFVEALSYMRDMQLDITQASSLDITAIQLVWAASRKAAKQGSAFRMAGSSPEQIRRNAISGGLEAFLAALSEPVDPSVR